jgi:hypothetical protein
VGVHTQMLMDIKHGRFKLQWYFGNILNQFVDNLNMAAATCEDATCRALLCNMETYHDA